MLPTSAATNAIILGIPFPPADELKCGNIAGFCWHNMTAAPHCANVAKVKLITFRASRYVFYSFNNLFCYTYTIAYNEGYQFFTLEGIHMSNLSTEQVLSVHHW